VAYLIYWDALSWDAGSLGSGQEVVPSRREALLKFRHGIKQADASVTHEVDVILNDPEYFVFDSGYSFYGIVIELPSEMQSVDAALAWMARLDEEDESHQLMVIAAEGVTIHPPDASRRSMKRKQCLELFLEGLR
jgi:hypothetical protein